MSRSCFGHTRGAFTGAMAAVRGKLVEADGGTLFLDEIGEMSLYAQARLLRVLETQEVQPLGGAPRTAHRHPGGCRDQPRTRG